jgi:hypothetical protein
MPMVRKNPLPVGRYWIFIQANSQDIFDLWLKKNADAVTVERKDTYGGLWPIIKPNETFYVFAVKEEGIIWPRGVGFPNSADATVKTPDDVKQRGPVPTAADVVKDIAETASEAATSMLTTAAVLALIWYFANKRGGR